VNEGLQGLGRFALLGVECVRSLRHYRQSGRELVRQLYFVGVKSQSVVLTTGAATGMVLCAQTYFQFHKVKMDTATGAVVSVGMCSELGPVLAALMLTARVGAAMAAELGTMKVTEQIDALRAFWNRYGNMISGLLVVVMVAFAGWSGWQAYQRRQAEQAGVVFQRTHPKVAAFTHWVLLSAPTQACMTEQEVLARTRAIYSGTVVAGEDLMRFDIAEAGVIVHKFPYTSVCAPRVHVEHDLQCERTDFSDFHH